MFIKKLRLARKLSHTWMRFEEDPFFLRKRTGWYDDAKRKVMTKKIAKYGTTLKYKKWLSPLFIQTFFVVLSKQPIALTNRSIPFISLKATFYTRH